MYKDEKHDFPHFSIKSISGINSLPSGVESTRLSPSSISAAPWMPPEGSHRASVPKLRLHQIDLISPAGPLRPSRIIASHRLSDKDRRYQRGWRAKLHILFHLVIPSMPSPTKSTPTMRDPKHASSESSSISHVPLFRAQSHQPSLDELKLSHILNGETCPPISFSDFAAFVAHQEFTTENLLFVIWYRSYRERYEQMSAEIKTAVPVPSTRLVDRYTPFAYLDKAMKEGLPERGPTSADGEVGFSVPADQSRPQQKTSFAQRQHGIKPCDWTIDGKACSCGNANHHHPTVVKRPSRFSLRSKEPSVPEPKPILQHSSLHPTLPPAGTVFIDPSQQPMREEVQRAFATFLKKGGSRELGMSDELREFARTCLLRSTAPESVSPLSTLLSVVQGNGLHEKLTWMQCSSFQSMRRSTKSSNHKACLTSSPLPNPTSTVPSRFSGTSLPLYHDMTPILTVM